MVLEQKEIIYDYDGPICLTLKDSDIILTGSGFEMVGSLGRQANEDDLSVPGINFEQKSLTEKVSDDISVAEPILSKDAAMLGLRSLNGPRSRLSFGGEDAEEEITPRARNALNELLLN